MTVLVGILKSRRYDINKASMMMEKFFFMWITSFAMRVNLGHPAGLSLPCHVFILVLDHLPQLLIMLSVDRAVLHRIRLLQLILSMPA